MDKEKKNYEKINETHQIENARQRKLKRRKISYIILIALILSVFFYLCYQYLFKIVSIEYVGNEHYSTETLSEAFGVKTGDRLFSYSKAKKEKELLESFPYLAECEIKRTVPDKVTITVKERKSEMYTYISGKYIIFDREMIVVEISNEEPSGLFKTDFDNGILLKCVLGKEIVFVDTKTGEGVRRVYESISSNPMYGKIKSLTVKSRFDYYIEYEDRFRVYLGDSTECPSKLLFLEGIIAKIPEEETGYIDISDYKKAFYRKDNV